PPKCTTLDSRGPPESEEELARPRSAVSLVREIAVIDAGNGKHPDEIKRDRGPHGHRTGANPKDAETSAMQDKERNAAHPVDPIWLVAHLRGIVGGMIGVKPLHKGG